MTAETKAADFIVIGAGIAGVSAAAALAEHGKVIVLEAEERPAFHSTGRSAAFYASGYGNDTIRALTAAGRDFFREPDRAFTDVPLLKPRDWIFVAREDQLTSLRETKDAIGDGVRMMRPDEVVAAVPILRKDYVAGGLIDERGGDLDVDVLLQAYLRSLRRRDGAVVCDARAEELRRKDGTWRIVSAAGEFQAPVVVNAAGAWADDIAVKAGLGALGVTPMRRTVLLIDGPAEPFADWPIVLDVDDDFYFKPDAGRMLLSPADETPSPPCDAQPDELDIAYAIEKFERATTLPVRRVPHKWAGLRMFASDRSPVAGFDPRAEGFFWLAGQGGYGIQTAPSLSLFAMNAITGGALPPAFASVRDLAEALSPARFLKA